METDTYVELAVRLGYLRQDEAAQAQGLVTQLSKMLTKLRSRLLEAEENRPL